MAHRSRIVAFGSAALLVVAGAVCAAAVGGLTGQVLAIVLITAGLGGALLLVFLEIGLGEDRERAAEDERRRRAERSADAKRRPGPRRWPRRPS